jgi:N6-adenosine-specific RNA methylase IME4
MIRLAKEQEREKSRQLNRELVEGTIPLCQDVDGPFSTIVVDPPWDWGDEGDGDQFGRGRPTYSTMTLGQLQELPVGQKALPNAHLYLWTTNRSLLKAGGLLEHWGFRYIVPLTWCKPSIGMGNYFRGSTEHVLFGVRGSLALLRHDVGTWFQADRGKQHSEKPEKFYQTVETCSPGPWLEIFARKQRPGWVSWGAEAS